MSSVVHRVWERCGVLSLLVVAFWLVGFFLMPIHSAAFWLYDWDYAESIYHWNSRGELIISDYPSMTLVTHLWWGKWWTLLLGDSMLALRVGSMVCATVVAIILNGLARTSGLSQTLSFVLIGAFLFNPLVLLYSQTFVTDMSGCLIMLALCVCFGKMSTSQATQNPNFLAIVGFVVVCGVLCAAAYLLSQIYIIPLISFVILNLFHGGIKTKLLVPLAIVTIAIGPIYYYWNWIETVNGEPLGFSKPVIDYGLLTQIKIILVKLVRMILTVSYHVWPLAVAAFLLLANLRWRIAILGLTAVAFAGLIYAPLLAQARPYFAYVSFDSNLGYLRDIGGLQEQWASSFDWEAVLLGLSVFSFITFAAGCLWYIQQHRSDLRSRLFAGAAPSVYGICLLTLLVYVGWLMVVVNVFDHHFLPVLALALACCIPLLRWMQDVRLSPTTSPSPTLASRSWRFATVLVLLVASTISALKTSDMLRVWDDSWNVAIKIMDEGAFPHLIDLGMPFHGTNIYRPELKKLIGGLRQSLSDTDQKQREKLLTIPAPRKIRFSTREGLGADFPLRHIRHEFQVDGFLDDYDLVVVQQ